MKKLLGIAVAVCVLITCLCVTSFAETAKRTIEIPENVEGGTYKVMRGSEELKNGDEIFVGDELTCISTPNEGYVVVGGTETTQHTVTAQDFMVPHMDGIEAEGWSKLEDDAIVYGGETEGLYKMISTINKDDNTATLHLTQTGSQTISFGWSINQGFIQYGKFVMNFYHNDVPVITKSFETDACPYGYIYSETYDYEATGDDTFKWVITRKSSNWADSEGRLAYIGQVETSDALEFVPTLPEFGTNRTVTVSTNGNGVASVSPTEFLAGDELTLNISPNDDYYANIISVKDSNDNELELTRYDDSMYTFIAPNSNVNVYVEFEPIKYISTKQDLLDFIDFANQNPRAYGVLTNDIDMGNAVIDSILPSTELIYNSNRKITQLGYLGIFNGNYHVISNFSVKSDGTKVTAGLFGTASGTIRNVCIDKASYVNSARVEGRYSVLCGQLLTGGMIDSCMVKNSNVDTNSNIGGAVAGCNYGGTISNCTSFGCTVSAYTRSGHLVGDNCNDDESLLGSLLNCYSDKGVYGGSVGNVSNCASDVALEQAVYYLNTENNTAESSKYWSVKNGFPSPADEENKPVNSMELYEDGILYKTFYDKIGSTVTFDDRTYASVTLDGNSVEKNADGKFEVLMPETDKKIIYASLEKYSITFETNDGTINSGNVTEYKISDEVTLPTDVTREGYTFAGWYENSDFSGSEVKTISKGTTGNKTYYAKWNKKYNVTFVLNSGVINSGSIDYYVETVGASLPTDVTKENYYFAGWYDNESFEGKAVTEISAEATGDKTYYARFLTLTEYIKFLECVTDDDGIITQMTGTWFVVPATETQPEYMQSEKISDSSQTEKVFTINVPAGEIYYISFDYFVSCETTFDYFQCLVDNSGTRLVKDSGKDKSGSVFATVGEGVHKVIFSYWKDVSSSYFQDLARISNLKFARYESAKKRITEVETTGKKFFADWDEAATVTAVFASYDSDGKLLDLDIQENTEFVAGANTITAADGFTVPENGSVNVMIFDSLGNAKPLCLAKSTKQ